MKLFALILILTFALAPGEAAADTFRDRVVEELTDDGFTQIRISRTLLGRTRFLATKPGARREIVMSPATGLILRDYLQIISENRSGSGGSSGNDDDDDDDDDDDEDNSGRGSHDDDDEKDDDDKDNSGSGSSNSGSGSSDDDDEEDD